MFRYIVHPNIRVTRYCHGQLETWTKNHLVSDKILLWMIETWINSHLVNDDACNIVESTTPQHYCITKERHIMLASHLVVVTHYTGCSQSVSSMTTRIGDTLSTIF